MMRSAKSRKISAVMAFVMSLSVLATGCQKTSEDTGKLPSLDEVSITTTETEETDVPEVTTVPTETTTEATTTTEVTTEETEETTAPTETTPAETSAAETSETSAQTWSETEMSATMYVTENCYSREKAIIGSTPISQHYAGDTVEVVAITDTEYYKLAEGGFIHSDYLSDTKPVVTTAATTTEAPAETTKSDSGNSGSDSSTDSGSSENFNTGGDLDDANYKVKSSSRYAYKQLNATEQKLYNNIVSSVKSLSSVVDVPSGLTTDDVVRVYTIVYNNEPQLFWMGGSLSAGTSSAIISFKTSDRNEIKAMQKEIDSAAASIISKANNYSGTVSKLKVFYDSIVLKNEFSKSDSGYNCSIYNGLTGNGALQCAGYAKSIQYLCDLAGIESTVVVGTDKNDNSHAWNVVYCENGYYNLDATWGDPINHFDSSYVQYEFFLVPDAWIHNITHYNVNTMVRGNGNKIHLFDPPACTKEACNYFAAYNKLYSTKSEAESAMYAAIDDAAANGKNVAEIRVTDKSIYDTLMSDDYFRTFQKYAKKNHSNVTKLMRQSSFTGGVYVVHYDLVY